MAAISRSRAIASIGPLRAWGFVAWLLWMGVHLYALTGFKNRVAVLLDWTVAFIGRGRPQRTITTQQVFARQVREAQAEAVSGAAAAFHAMAPAPARPAPGRSSGSSHEDQPDVAARDLATVCVRHELGLPPDHAVALGIDAGQAHAVGRERRPERSGERARAAVGHALRVPRAAGRQEHPPRALNGGQGRHAAVEHRLQVRAERDGVRHKVGPPGRGRAREVSAAAVADDRRTRGSDTPALLSAAAQRLEPLDPGLARETHLEALLASVRSGRFACIEGVVEAADGGDIRL
jgi:hypothetical protein